MYVHRFFQEFWKLDLNLWNFPVTVLDFYIPRKEIHSIKIHIVYSLKYFSVKLLTCQLNVLLFIVFL